METSSISGSTSEERIGSPGLITRLISIVTLLLAGCAEPGPVDALDDYLQKLERVLEQGAHPLGYRAMPKLPAARLVRRDFDSGSIDVIEFLQFDRCELQRLVAERNSSLGKLAHASQRLVYEINFLRAGSTCLAAIHEDYPELAEMLAATLAMKREVLPAVIWQATLGGPEFRAFWRFGNVPVPERFDSDGSLLLALRGLSEDIERWLSGVYEVDSQRLESQLSAVRHGRGGVQLRAWMLLANKLDIASGILEDRLARRRLCFEGMARPPAADILDNVVRDVLIGEIQPWVARLNSRYYELFPRIRQLELLLSAGEPPAYAHWRSERDEHLDYATRAPARHAEALMPVFDQCELGPAAMRGVDRQ